MSPLIIVCAALMLLSPSESDSPGVSPKDRAAYEEAKAKAGRGAEANAKLALWCENHGFEAERMKHLTIAILTDPRNALARGLMGMVSYQGGWRTPDQVGKNVEDDADLAARLADYNARRHALETAVERERSREDALRNRGNILGANDLRVAANRGIAEAHVRLGMWCEANGLKPEALAHFTTAVHLDPYRDSTWKHLGCVKHHGRWMTHEQVASAEKEALEQRLADRRWMPVLSKWKGWLDDKAHRATARDELAKVTDPRAVPAIQRVFGQADPAAQLVEVDLLGQIDSPPSTRTLAALAVFSDDERVRDAAIETIKGREPRDYAGALVEMIHAPIAYEVKPVAGPGSKGELVIDTPRYHLVRTYEAPPAFKLTGSFYGYVGTDPNGLPVVISGRDLRTFQKDLESPGGKGLPAAERILEAAEAKTQNMLLQAAYKAEFAHQRLMSDVEDIKMANVRAEILNRRIAELLGRTLGAPANLGGDENAWHIWWNERIGYRYTPAPKVTLAQNAIPQLPPYQIVSCFAAGTPVRTIHDPRAIETLRVGDLVLSQDTSTGALSFEPILFVYKNPPDVTVRVTLDHGESIVASRFHRFWRAGQGWCMAKDLKHGDVLRVLDGVSRVSRVESAPVQPVFNLDVARLKSFFVGTSAALVHDNTLPDPHLKPFDRLEFEKATQ